MPDVEHKSIDQKIIDTSVVILRCAFIIFFTIVFIIDTEAQTRQLKFEKITGANGVPVGTINAITQDKFGFIWFSDETNQCISRYDGSSLKQFKNDPADPNSLGGYYPECFYADPSGILWIGFYGQGLDRYDPMTETFTHYRHDNNDPESLSDDIVSTVLRDHLGNLWVGNNGGLDLLDEQTGKFKCW